MHVAVRFVMLSLSVITMGIRQSAMTSANGATLEDLLAAAQYCVAQESDNSRRS